MHENWCFQSKCSNISAEGLHFSAFHYVIYCPIIIEVSQFLSSLSCIIIYTVLWSEEAGLVLTVLLCIDYGISNITALCYSV